MFSTSETVVEGTQDLVEPRTVVVLYYNNRLLLKDKKNFAYFYLNKPFSRITRIYKGVEIGLTYSSKMHLSIFFSEV